MVRVMIADDHLLMRRVLREVIEQESDLELVAEASNGNEAEQLAAQTQPDVVLMDLDMPGCDGFEATERVLACSPRTRVVIFSASNQVRDAYSAIQRGAVGYLTKDIEAAALIAAIRAAAHDEFCMAPRLANQVVSYMRSLANESKSAQEAGSPLSKASSGRAIASPAVSNDLHPPTGRLLALTEREREVLHLIYQGRKNREIAGELRIAESTVHKHIQNIFEKLHARNRTEAIYLTRMAGA